MYRILLYSTNTFLRSALHHLQQLNFKDKSGTARDHAPSPTLTVSQLRGGGKFDLFALAHALDPLIPPLDDLADAQLEIKRLVAVVGGIEFLAVGGQCAQIMDLWSEVRVVSWGGFVYVFVWLNGEGMDGVGGERGEQGDTPLFQPP